MQKKQYNEFNNQNSIRDIPLAERPRERLISKGPSSLSLIELLEIIISKGSNNTSVVDVAYEILSKFPQINKLKDANITDLTQIKGIGTTKACQLVATFELVNRLDSIKQNTSNGDLYSAKTLFKLLRPYYLRKNKEHLIVTSLDSRKKIIAIDVVSIGTINETIAHPREVFKVAIDRLATYVVIAHNHPSGDIEPSSDDLRLTRRLLDVSYTIGIPLIDHLILSDTDFISLKDKNLLD